MTESATGSRQSLRRMMRGRRRALGPRQQDRAARQLARLLARQPLFQRSRHIAFYLANDGEIDPLRLLRTALRRGKRCYLPTLHPSRSGSLMFIRYTAHTPLTPNRYGIAEPAMGSGRRMPARQLDLVFLPLVAFDYQGARLGMGAGFYDRTFAFKAGQKRHSPVLVGLAHSCQAVEQGLPVQAWDIPVSAIATESGVVACTGSSGERNFLRRDLRRGLHV